MKKSQMIKGPLRRLVNVVSAAGGVGAAARYGLRLLRTEGPAGLSSRVSRHILGRSPAGGGNSRRSSDSAARVALAARLRVIDFAEDELAAKAAELIFDATPSPELSVIVVMDGTPREGMETLAALRAAGAELAGGIEVLAVVNATDQSQSDLIRLTSGVQMVGVDVSLSHAERRDRAIASSSAEFVLLLDAAIQVQPGALKSLIARLRSNSSVALAGGCVLTPDAVLIEAGAGFRPDGEPHRFGEGDDASDPSYAVSRQVDGVSEMAMVIRRGVLEQMGAFVANATREALTTPALMLAVRAAGHTIFYEAAALFVRRAMSAPTLTQSDVGGLQTLQARWGREIRAASDIRVLAFYLPQYHPIAENDEWWGKGFTEWSNVSKAKPNFDGHYQPHRPADLGFYDLRVPEVREEQARLARQAGLAGFCYYYYWFSGHKLLERPLQEVLSSGKPDFPFCICWANENWTRRWDGLESSLLIGQSYGPEDAAALFRDWLPLLRDERYIRIDGKPLVLIYRISLLPDPRRTAAIWRRLAREAGLGDLYLAYVQSFDSWARGEKPADFDFDASVEFPPHGCGVPYGGEVANLSPKFRGALFDYEATAATCLAKPRPDYPMFRGVMPSWDNTARKQDAGHIFIGASPQAYERWLEQTLDFTDRFAHGDERIVFVNAWNEWGEGNHLEPDVADGHAYLDATRRALARWTDRVGAK